MKKLSKILLLSILGVFLVSTSSWAYPINSARQWGSTGSLNEVQTVFDTIGSTLNAYGDQEMDAYFNPAGGGGSTAAYVAQVSWSGGNIEFGIYEYGDITNTLKLFDLGTTTVGDLVYFEFNYGSNYVKSFTSSSTIQQTTYFDDFGFYAKNTAWASNPGPFYSDDALNTGGFARMLTYEANGNMVDINGDGVSYTDYAHWYIAGETGNYGSSTTWSGDFSDLIVQIESISPVSEPATMLLLGTGLIGLAGFSRKRFKK